MAIASAASAQDGASPQVNAAPPPVIEEVQVLGRLVSGAEQLVMERIEQEVAMDIIGAEQIGRIGDSTVAAALRRVPGITLVDDKFVYVRGLGERYSSTFLNGAVVPSPDLQRNVIPLDIFPTSIIESLSVQKVASADMSAAFGGGAVDIRTTGIPDGFVFNVELGSGFNTTQSDGDVLTYNGGGDDDWGEDDGTRALPNAIDRALSTYRGSFASMDAETNRELATALYRDISISEESGEEDLNIGFNVGNLFAFDNGMEAGFMAGLSYDRNWRTTEVFRGDPADLSLGPNEVFGNETETSYSVDLSANFSAGINLNSENSIETTSIFLRNTDDEVSITDFFNNNRQVSGGRGFRDYSIRYEERELTVNQIHGSHELGYETRDMIGWDWLEMFDGLTYKWYFSDSEATTDIPSEVSVRSNTTVNTANGNVLETSVRPASNSATYRFTDLQDYAESWGGEFSFPIEFSNSSFKLTAGFDYWEKSRTYEQLQFNLGTTTVSATDPVLVGPLGTVFSDANILNADNGYELNVEGGNTNSYIAANRVDAGYGKIDMTFSEAYRLVLGARYEDYQQVNLAWDPIEYETSQLACANGVNQQQIADCFVDSTFQDDDVYLSAAFTWMVPGFWAEDFQLRVSFAETTVRPDIREIANSSYRDPITDFSVTGNPDVVPSQVENFDIRAEWFFSNGDNFTLSYFFKDITDPIELFQAAATDDNTAAEIHNAATAELSGIEVEWLSSLGNFVDSLDAFFLQGNVTLLDHEIEAGDSADAPTNETREMAGASDYAVNLILGFDSYDGKHASTLSYNVFGERLFFAGRLGAPDSFEQPFQSLDLTYSFYPTENFTVKAKVKNILDESVEVTQEFTNGEVTIFEEDRGQEISLSVQYDF